MRNDMVRNRCICILLVFLLVLPTAYSLASMAEVIALLASGGVGYASLWINNTIQIPAADRDLVCQLSSRFAELDHLYPEYDSNPEE